MLNNFTSGKNTTFSDELNENSAAYITQSGLNLIRQLKNRDVVLSGSGQDGFVEAYVSKSGQKNTIQDSELFQPKTTAFPIFKDFTAAQDGQDVFEFESYGVGFNNQASGSSNVFDEDTNTSETISQDPDISVSYGDTFSSQTVTNVYFKAEGQGDEGNGIGAGVSVDLQTYDGSSWNNEKTYSDGGSDPDLFIEQGFLLNKTVEGIRLKLTTDGDSDFNNSVSTYELAYATDYSTGIISHSLSLNQTASTVNNVIGVPLVNNWESGANIDFRLSNSSNTTKWFNATPVKFHELDSSISSPTELEVRLDPASNPQPNTPSLDGFYLYTS